MSRKGHYRAAVSCAKLTGTSHHRCVAWEKQGLISPRQPVPDAETAEQRSLEALIVNVLANALRDRQLGAVLGVDAVLPAPKGATLRMHPAMADRVLWELLPRYDSEYGGIRGVPGLRVAWEASRIVLRDLLSPARVLVAPPADPRSMMHKLIPPEQPLWLDGNTRLHPDEPEERSHWTQFRTLRPTLVAARDWLLSRMLRRPLLINTTGREHGWANTYTHLYEDLVIEWCCADSPEDVAGQLQQAGLTAWPDDPTLGPPGPPREGHLGMLWLGDAYITLRRIRGCTTPPPTVRFRDRTEWYR